MPWGIAVTDKQSAPERLYEDLLYTAFFVVLDNPFIISLYHFKTYLTDPSMDPLSFTLPNCFSLV